jgi:hypothetical protein
MSMRQLAGRRWSFLVGAVLASLSAEAAAAQAEEMSEGSIRGRASAPVVSAGFSALLLQSYMFNHTGLAINASLDGGLGAGWSWSVGARLGLGPVLPEGFARLSASPAVGRWVAAVGLELGVTARTRYRDASGGVAQALRAQAQDEASPLYLALHAAPLRFRIWDRWRLSVAELQIGSHLGRLGEHVRVQIGLVQVGRML